MKDYSDIAAWAEQQNLESYNGTILLMEADRMIPGYEQKTFDIYIGVGRDYGYGEKLSNILDLYASEHGPTEITL